MGIERTIAALKERHSVLQRNLQASHEDDRARGIDRILELNQEIMALCRAWQRAIAVRLGKSRKCLGLHWNQSSRRKTR